MKKSPIQLFENLITKDAYGSGLDKKKLRVDNLIGRLFGTLESISIYFILTVTVANSPSGTFATIIPIRKTIACNHGYSIATEIIKNDIPRNTATPVIM